MPNKIITFPFTESYLDHLMKHIEENYLKEGKDISRLGIVFGGKRPALYVKRALAKRMKESFYPPKMFSIDEFVDYTIRKHESYTSTADLDNCYLLYQLAKKHTPEILNGRETFAQFLPWTREILAFIDQLDLENVQDAPLKSIEHNAEIGYAVPEDINKLLQSIVLIRNEYHKQLKGSKVYSRGLQYHRAAGIIEKVSFDEFDQVLFCNFFYFNRSEEALVKSLYERDKATLIFQGDERKWPVLKRIAGNLSARIREGEEPQAPQFDLNLYSGFDAHSQVGVVREILKNIKKKSAKDLENTVIVLPNADNIIPLLSEVTSIANEFNISMGYPLKRSSLYSLFGFVFQAQKSRKEHRYYAKDYLKVLRHPFIKNLKIKEQSTITRVLVHKIEEILTGKLMTSISGSLFFELEDIETLDELYMLSLEVLDRMGIKTSRKDLQTVIESIHRICFSDWEKVADFKEFSGVLGQFLDILIDKSFLSQYPLNNNIASRMYDIRDEFAEASFNTEKFPQEDLFKIFDSKVTRELMAFTGSPLKGLQILGLFETRSLSFENVIMMDVNEGVLPKLNIYEPLIPREVMISLNLDRLELEEEIQRYQFMRLISSSSNVHLVYQQSKDKERSRFVEELVWSEQKKSGQYIKETVLQAGFDVKVGQKKKVIQKTPDMIKMLKQHTFSASSINTYLRDPLEFYTSYVLGLREQEDLLDEPEARHVGTFIHELLEESFKPFLNKKPKFTETFRAKFTKAFDRKFDHSFGRTMKSDSFLLKSVVSERLNRFLDHEENHESRQINKVLHLESRFQDTIPLPSGKMKFSFIVDRIDQLKDGTIMIVDYKTGSIDQMPRPVDEIAKMKLSRDTIRDNIRSFQIPLYYYYLQKEFKGKLINAALYNLRTLEMKKFLDQTSTFERDRINEVFLGALDYVMCEILDPSVPFTSEE